MTLFRQGSDAARSAMPMLASLVAMPVSVAERSEENDAPSAEQAALEALAAKNAALVAELADLRAGWQAALAKARAEAVREAAAAHVRNDERVFGMLCDAVAAAHAEFDEMLRSEIEPAATMLAAAALRLLVEPRQGEADWLARLIARRVGELSGDAVAVIRVPEAARAAVDDGLMPPGMCVEADPGLAAGTARIELRLGAIPIVPGEGLARLLAQMTADTGDD